MSTEARPTKAVILARGLGTRMRKAATTELSEKQQQVAALGVKAMMPISDGDDGHPFVDYVMSALADAGLTDICLVIGDEHGFIRDYYDGLDKSRVSVSYAIQAEPRGTADAVLAAREFCGDERFVMLNSDNYYPATSLKQLVEAPGTATLAFDAKSLIAKSNIPEDRVQAFAIIDADEQGHLSEIIEKPSAEELAAHPEPQVSMNCFMFEPSIFDACERIEPSPRGELEIQSAIRLLVSEGTQMTVVPSTDGVLDMSGRGDVPSVVAALSSITPEL